VNFLGKPHFRQQNLSKHQQVVQNSLGTGTLQSTVSTAAEAGAEQGRTRFRLHSHWPKLVTIAVVQGADKKNTLWKTKEALEVAVAIHVRSCNHRILRYSTHCLVVGQGLDSLMNFLEADQEADHSLHSNSCSSCSPAAVDFAVADHSIHHIPAAGVEVRTSG